MEENEEVDETRLIIIRVIRTQVYTRIPRCDYTSPLYITMTTNACTRTSTARERHNIYTSLYEKYVRGTLNFFVPNDDAMPSRPEISRCYYYYYYTDYCARAILSYKTPPLLIIPICQGLFSWTDGPAGVYV